MPIKIVNEYLDAVYHLYSLAEDKILCNEVKDKSSIESRISLPTADIVSAYLVLAFTRSNNIDILKWKISFNDVILTRELKPHVEKPIDEDHMQTMFVYDISKIIPKNEASIKISCTAKGYINLDSAILLTIMRYKGFHTHIACEIEPHTVNDNFIKSYNLSPSFTANETYLHLGLVSPTTGTLEIRTDNGVIKKFHLLKGHNLIEAYLGNNSLGLIQIQSNANVRHLFSCIAVKHTQYPQIIIENLNTQGAIIRFRLRNTGNSSCDSLDLILLRYGIPLRKTSLASLKPGEYLDLEINIGDILKQGVQKINGIVLRIVWSKAHKLFEYDVPIKF